MDGTVSRRRNTSDPVAALAPTLHRRPARFPNPMDPEVRQ